MTYDNTPNSSGSSMSLGARFEILPNTPLPEFNTAGGQAFVARLKGDTSSNFYAIVCQEGPPPRLDSVNSMRTIDNPSILRLMDSGVINWLNNSRAYAFVYQKPLSPRMTAVTGNEHPKLTEDSINTHFITPMIDALAALAHAGIVHNNIRPDNIFWRIGTASPPQIGECLSTPAGLAQPILFEPVERALAMPMGRGQGVHADDCYAFGVTLALLVIGHNPLDGMSDNDIIEAKMQRGTFSIMIGNHRLSPMHIEILRGLLADDARQRWSALDLDQWLSGRRMTPKSSDAGRRASRHFDFGGKEYWQLAPLVVGLSSNPTEATRIIENESLHKWLRRAMNDDDRARDVETAIAALKESGKTAHYEDQLVARVCIALDHAAPIRYRGLSTMPAGVASLLADTMMKGSDPSAISELISSQLPQLWISMQKDYKGDFISLGQLFDRLKNVLEKPSYGNGIERATYEANLGLPCLSPMLRGQYVTSPKMLMPALERVASGGNRPREPMDRHIAAFLIVHDKRSESSFAALTAPEGSIARGLALLNLYGEMQYRHGPENLPQLASWLAPIAEPALKRYLGRALREQLQKQMKDAVNSGNLSAMLRLMDDNRRLDRDRQEFMAARMLYLNIRKEIIQLEAKLNNRESVVRAAGKPMAASISSFLAIVLICAAIVRALFGALLAP